MPSVNRIVLASIPKCSTAKVSIKEKDKFSGKEKDLDDNSLLKKASKQNRVAVVIDAGTPVEQSVYSQQDTRQVYVTQSRSDQQGKVTEVLIARYEDGVYVANDPDGSLIVNLLWVDVKHVSCGILADAMITIPGKQPVQTEPEVETIIRIQETWTLQQSYVFFDPFIHKSYVDGVKRGAGIQRGIAAALGITSEAEIKRRVHLIPLFDITEQNLKTDAKLKESDQVSDLLGICEMKQLDGTAASFVEFCKREFKNKVIEVIAINGHGGFNPSLIRLDNRNYKDATPQRFIAAHVRSFLASITSVKKIVLLACSVGDLRNTENLSHTIAVMGKDKVTEGVIAADGKTSATIISTDHLPDINNYIVRTGKYDEKGNRVEGGGWCLYRGDLVNHSGDPQPKILTYTQAKPVKVKDEIQLNENGQAIWKEYDIKISDLLTAF